MNPTKLILILAFILPNLCTKLGKPSIDTSNLKKKAGTSLGLGCPIKKLTEADNPFANKSKPLLSNQAPKLPSNNLKKNPLVLPKDHKNPQNKQQLFNIYELDEEENQFFKKPKVPIGTVKMDNPKTNPYHFQNPNFGNEGNTNPFVNNGLFRKPVIQETKPTYFDEFTNTPVDLLAKYENDKKHPRYPFEQNIGQPKTDSSGKFLMPYENPFGLINPFFARQPLNPLYKKLNFASQGGVQNNQPKGQTKPVPVESPVRKIPELSSVEFQELLTPKRPTIAEVLLKSEEKKDIAKISGETGPFVEHEDFESMRSVLAKQDSHVQDNRVPVEETNQSKIGQLISEESYSPVVKHEESQSKTNVDSSQKVGRAPPNKDKTSNLRKYSEELGSNIAENGSLQLQMENESEDELDTFKKSQLNRADKLGTSELDLESDSEEVIPPCELQKSQSMQLISPERIEVPNFGSKDDGLIDYRSIMLDMGDDYADTQSWQRDFIKRSQVPRASVMWGMRKFSIGPSFTRNSLGKPIRKIKQVYLFEVIKCRECQKDRYMNKFISNGFNRGRMSFF